MGLRGIGVQGMAKQIVLSILLLTACSSPVESIRQYELIEHMQVGEFRQLRTRTVNTNISWRSTNQSVIVVRSIGRLVEITAVGKGAAQVVGSNDYDPQQLEIFRVEVE